MAKKQSSDAAPIKIKKYANRRLYNTAASKYVTLDHLCQMVKEGIDFVVSDAKSGEDITRAVLTQIIVEEEGKGQNLLPIGFLRQLISFYGDSMQWMVPNYLEHSMNSFARNQKQMRQYFQETMSGKFPFGTLEDMGKQNMVMFERAMNMFTTPTGDGASAGSAAGAPSARGQALEFMQMQVDELQKQIDLLGAQSAGQALDALRQQLEALQTQIAKLKKG